MRRKGILLLVFGASTIFIACSDDDVNKQEPTGYLFVRDQPVIKGTLIIHQVELDQDGWLIVYRDELGVQGTEVLGYSKVQAGNHKDVPVNLFNNVSVNAGEVLWAALHVDLNANGVLDWDGSMGPDVAITAGTEKVSESFVIQMGNSLVAEDQPLIEGAIKINSVNLIKAGYISVFINAGENNWNMVGQSRNLKTGSHQNILISFEDPAEINPGDLLLIKLFLIEDFFEVEAIGSDGNPVETFITVLE